MVSFGESVKLLHSFDQPWSDDAGASVVSKFTFRQRRTDTAATLRSIVSLLDVAKQGVRASSAGVSTQCLQLVFMISDGRFDRDRRDVVRRWVREAAQRNQLLVLLVCDGPDPSSSILETKSVRYVDALRRWCIDPHASGVPSCTCTYRPSKRPMCPPIALAQVRQWTHEHSSVP